MDTLSFAVTGDALAVQRLPRSDPRLLAIRKLLQQADVRFTNLETSIHDGESDIYPSRHSGGDWISAPPAVLADLAWLGFNLLSTPSNHSLDWGHSGLLKTIEHLERQGIAYAGIGRNLAEAARPRYLETAQGRVALIAVNTSFRDWHPAGEQRRDFIGRPGINALHFTTVHRVSEADLERLKAMASATEINKHKRDPQQPEGVFRFGEHLFAAGEPGTYTYFDRRDAERIGRSIREAARQADLVLVSSHSHEMKGTDKSLPADFQRDFAHWCIDAGAHAYIGHGPHVIRGVEIYRERPIFHGLGDLFYQAELIERQPAEFYEKYGNLSGEQTTADGYDFRIDSGKDDKMNNEVNPKTYESFIGCFTFAAGTLQAISLHPVTLGFSYPRSRKGTPEPAGPEDNARILQELRELSQPFHTRIGIEDGTGVIAIERNG